MTKPKIKIQDQTTIEETFYSLKVFKNGTGLAVIVPQSYVKKTGLKSGGIVDVTFTAYKIDISQEMYLNFAKFYQLLCKGNAEFESFDMDTTINLVMFWLIESKKPIELRRTLKQIILDNEKRSKTNEEKAFFKDLMKLANVTEKNLAHFNASFEKAFAQKKGE